MAAQARSSASGGSRGLVQIKCPNHPNADLIEDYRAGDVVCRECGLVVGDRVVDVGSEWRTFSNEKAQGDPSRVGAAENPLLDGHDLSTSIGTIRGDDTLRRLQNRNPSGPDRALMSAFREISNMAERLNLPHSIMDRCNVLFKQVHQEKHLRGRTNDAIASACLFIACRQDNCPRTFKEICAVSKVSKKEIGRCFKLILRALETTVDPAGAGDFMARFCSNLGLPLKIQRAASHIATEANRLDLCPGKVYTSVAAAAIYMASQASETKKTQKEVGDVVGVADVTIRAAYRSMYPRRVELFPQGVEFTTAPQNLPPI
ncbi:transcription initiation factor IIB-like [Sycon ciliatum]|uniref:transcription initiation factor IIB-like n=1 Tax=Sycon ciliatum TaxID=27933 RepID=UPI0020A87BB9|eukprot:scpid64445/ scgid32333/ Transcription initiation factor IIB; General transcription factor TFIIB